MANIPAQLYRGDSDYLGTISNVDGQILFDTDKKEIFVDDGTTRESYGGGSATVISYANFSQLTPQEQESGNYLVTGMPSLTNAYNIEYKNGVDVGTELDNINTDLSDIKDVGTYSTTETKIGKWIDGTSDVYRLILNKGSNVTMASNTWVDLTVPKTGITCVLNATAISTITSGTAFPLGVSIGDSSKTTIQLSNIRSGAINADIFIIEYVK